MKTVKLTLVVVAAVLTLSANVLNAAANNDSPTTNQPGSSTITIPSAQTPAGCEVAADASASTNLLALIRSDSSMTFPSNASAFSADAACCETRTLRNDFTSWAEALTETPYGAGGHKSIHFFSGAVITVGRSSDSPDWDDSDSTAFNRLPANASWAGGDAATRRGPRGLKLFNWSW